MVSDSVYQADAYVVLKRLKDDLRYNRVGYTNTEFFEGTNIYIDTILYSPSQDKFAIFVITENPAYRQLRPNKQSKWYYNGDCYLGRRYSKDSIFIALSGPRLTNGITKESIKKDMYDTYFNTFSKFKNESGELRYKYDLGDNRFWNCPIWDEIERKRIKEEEFEKENPINIYEPKYVN